MTIQSLNGRGMASQVPPLAERPYRYRGIPGWVPGGLGPLPARPASGGAHKQRDEAAARRERFAALRKDGLSVAEAGAEVGISFETARRYEALRRRERASGE